MCGIAGELRVDGARASLEAVAAMTDQQVARGPDAGGTWARGPVALGHRRLQIVDLTDAGAQPMVDEDRGLALVFNGCIYNHHELRAELRRAGHRFRSTSDTEVLLVAFHHWGTACLERLRGMFAFAVVDLRTGRTVLARDRLGIKPLYLAPSAGRLRFASTLPALLAAGDVDTSIDPVALHHHLTFHAIVPAPRTLLAGVRKVPPATVVEVDPDGTTRERVWWSPPQERDPDRADWSDREWIDAVGDALRTAVAGHLTGDVPVGLLLSGGLDSSLLAALLVEEGAQDLPTFSIGFRDAGGLEGDEFRWSDQVARELGTDHHQIRIPSARLLDSLGPCVAAMPEPLASHDTVAFWLLSQEVARHVKVVQSGQGADEVFAGYHWFQELGDVLPPVRAADAYLAAFRDRTHDEAMALVAPEHRCSHDATAELVRSTMALPGADDALDRALRLEVRTMMPDDPVKRVDAMSMAFGLEARVPFLDHEVVELAARCPGELLLADGGKGVLKELARKVLPGELVDRPKGYFPVPGVVHLAEGTVAELAEVLRAPEARARGLFAEGVVEELLADPNGRHVPTGGNVLWHVALLEWWLQQQGIR